MVKWEMCLQHGVRDFSNFDITWFELEGFSQALLSERFRILSVLCCLLMSAFSHVLGEDIYCWRFHLLDSVYSPILY